MPTWDLAITMIIIAAAAFYVILSSYKTIKAGFTGCSGGCSGCSQRNSINSPDKSKLITLK